jgi:uncharacterized protein
MVDCYSIFYGLVVVFFASIIQGLVGFGFALVSVPLLMLYFSHIIVVPNMLIQSALINLIIVIEAKKHMELKRMIPLMLAGGLGSPVGVFLLKMIEEKGIKVFVGVLLIFSSILLLLGYRKYFKNEKLAFLSVGFVSGILSGSTAMSGPPVILFYNNQGIEKTRFRANLVLYFLFLNIFGISIMSINGILSKNIFPYVMLFSPTTLIGVSIGIMLSKKINENIFKKITLFIILMSGIIALISGLN